MTSSRPLAEQAAPGTEETARDVTVVVMTRDRWPDLCRTLPRHAAPVILVDNASSDETVAQVRRHFPHVRVVRLGRNHGAVARNIGVRLATTPYVAFADDDSWWEPGALTTAARILEDHPRLAVLAGSLRVGDGGTTDPACDAMAASALGSDPSLPGPAILGFLACGAVVRREAFLEAGGFDDVVFFMGEEERLALDLASHGWDLAYVESVVAHHDPSPDRDPDARLLRAARNELLTMVMRRPWPVVGRTLVRRLATSGPQGRASLRAALPVLPRALARRRPVPTHVERARRLLDAT